MKPQRPPLETAVRYLAKVARTENEVRAYLAGRGHDDASIDSVIDRLGALGYLDDRRLAVEEAARLDKYAKVSRFAIESKLTQRGLEEPVLSEALKQDLTDDLAKARSVAAKRKDSDPARLARHLAGKGFEEETVLQVLAEFFPGLDL